jgi:hypothetical protein
VLAAPAGAQDLLSPPEIVAGQDLIYRGRFGAAQVYFAGHAASRPRDPVPRVFEASALVWWGEARDDEGFQAESIDVLLDDAIARARLAADAATDWDGRAQALFWLGTAYGYRGRQAELRGNVWRASRDARAMRTALDSALAIAPACVDCLLGLGVYDYALARANAVARVVTRILGLGGGDATRGLERLRQVSEEGGIARTEARWIYANALLREGERDPALREEGLRIIGDLVRLFPDNPVFRRAAQAPAPGGP